MSEEPNPFEHASPPTQTADDVLRNTALALLKRATKCKSWEHRDLSATGEYLHCTTPIIVCDKALPKGRGIYEVEPLKPSITRFYLLKNPDTNVAAALQDAFAELIHSKMRTGTGKPCRSGPYNGVTLVDPKVKGAEDNIPPRGTSVFALPAFLVEDERFQGLLSERALPEKIGALLKEHMKNSESREHRFGKGSGGGHAL